MTLMAMAIAVIVAVFAAMGALIGSLFGKAIMFAIIGGLIPIAWFIVVVSFYTAGFVFLKKMFGN